MHGLHGRRRALAAAVVVGVAAISALVPTPAAAATRAGGESAEVEILDPGVEPRVALRLAPVPAVQAGQARFRLGVTQTAEGETEETKPGDIVLPFDAQSAVETPGGPVTLAVTYGAPEVQGGADPDFDADLVSVLEPVTGSVTTFTFDPTGVLLDASSDIDEQTDTGATAAAGLAGLDEQLDDQITARFPEEPVGEGARWRVTSTFELEGIKIENRYEYRLRRLEGTTLELDIRVVQRARRGTRSPEEDGRFVEVVSYRNTGRATIVQDLGRLVPLESTLTLRGRHVLRVRFAVDRGEDEPEPVTITQRFEGGVKIERGA